MAPVVVITGASGGIGAATAELLGARGKSVALVARRRAELEAIAARCGADAFPIVADATRREEIQRVIEATMTRFGRIDVWINNIGQGITRMPSELTDQDVDEMMRVNVKSALYGMQEILPHFRERGTGHIINLSSMLGRIPYATYRAAYTAAKHYLNALTANFRDELSQTHPGIRISLVSPPAVRTDFGLHAMHGGPDSRSLSRSQSAEETARAIAWVIETGAADAYTTPGSRDRVISYFSTHGVDAEPA